MLTKLKDFFIIPSAIQSEFQQDSLQKNKLSLWLISIMIFGMELFNLARVLFFSQSGLGTLNNRIYFSMYCVLLLGAAFSLLLQYKLRTASVRAQYGVQIGSVAFFFLWHILLNVYDLIRDPQAESYVFISALVGLAMFIQMPGKWSAIFFGAGYALFMALSGSMLDGGTVINLTIMTCVAMAITITRSHHTAIELAQRKEINRINAHLQLLLKKDPLTGLLNKKAFQDCAERALNTLAAPESLALLMIDIDDFKQVNDQHGHPCGDYVLEQTARKIQEAFPDASSIGRIGGDEFSALLPADRNVLALEKRGVQFAKETLEMSWQGKLLQIHCSIGVVWVGTAGISYARAYQEMDDALYEAKQNGKNSCCVREI